MISEIKLTLSTTTQLQHNFLRLFFCPDQSATYRYDPIQLVVSQSLVS